MSIEKMREEFEAFWSETMNTQVMDLHRCNFNMQKPDFVQPYACHETQRGWLSWQASRATVVIELPSNSSIYLHCYSPKATKEYCRQAIEAAGIKVKS